MQIKFKDIIEDLNNYKEKNIFVKKNESGELELYENITHSKGCIIIGNQLGNNGTIYQSKEALNTLLSLLKNDEEHSLLIKYINKYDNKN